MRELLYRLYVVERKTSADIAKIIGVSPKTAVRRLHQYGIELRPPGPERHELLRDSDWCRAQYASGLNHRQIAEMIGAAESVVSSWMRRHAIEVRPDKGLTGRVISEAQRKQISAFSKTRKGPLNPNWKGGARRAYLAERATFQSKEWSKSVRKRDGFRCVDCGDGGRLHAHHVLSWKDYPEKRFDVDNGVTVCVACHEVRHGRRFPGWLHQDGESAKSANHPQG